MVIIQMVIIKIYDLRHISMLFLFHERMFTIQIWQSDQLIYFKEFLRPHERLNKPTQKINMLRFKY